MRFTFVILLFCGLGADAQMIIKAHANYVPFAVGITPPLDIYTGAAAAYSLRKLRTAYTGSAIRVRRSNDNTEQDIGFTSSGDLDTASLKTFVGANNAFVTTWYDQSGNARNATQSTAANQPRIVVLGVIERLESKPSIFFRSTNIHYLTHSVIQTSPTRLYIFSSLSSDNTGNIWSHRSESTRLIQLQTNGNVISLFLRSNLNIFYSATTTATFTPNTDNTILVSARFDVSNNTHISYLNGNASATNTTNFSGQTFNSTVNTIGATTTGGGSFSTPINGKYHELIIYTSDQSSNRTGIENNINTYYSIY
jgi:hypothetical protein